MEKNIFIWIQILTAIACSLQSLEFLWLHFSKTLPTKNATLLTLDIASLIFSATLFFVPESAFVLMIVYFIRYVFYRGPFNGGSDAMTHILLLTLSVGVLFSTQSVLFRAALLYLGLQTILSYFVAGVVKLRSPAWWKGLSLKFILVNSPYPIPSRVKKLFVEGPWSVIFSWGILIFEVAFPTVLLSFPAALVFLSVAFFFHLANAFVLGLNRFFWAWIAAFPAIFYLSALTRQ